jgi:hypothetical protein
MSTSSCCSSTAATIISREGSASDDGRLAVRRRIAYRITCAPGLAALSATRFTTSHSWEASTGSFDVYIRLILWPMSAISTSSRTASYFARATSGSSGFGNASRCRCRAATNSSIGVPAVAAEIASPISMNSPPPGVRRSSSLAPSSSARRTPWGDASRRTSPSRHKLTSRDTASRKRSRSAYIALQSLIGFVAFAATPGRALQRGSRITHSVEMP